MADWRSGGLAMAHIARREFIGLLGGGAVAVRPIVARAQAVPVVGYLSSAREREYTHLTTVFIEGLAEGGYTEGRNVTVAYRWAEGEYQRLPALAADLVQRNVSVIVAHGPPAARAAKAATSTIPIVFTTGDDPIRTGLVSSISRPGGNVTGVSMVVSQVLTKRVEILHEFLPNVSVMAVLVNPNSTLHDVDRQEAAVAAQNIGIQMHVLEATADPDLDRVFTVMGERRVGGLVVGADPFYNTRRSKVVALSAQHRIPTMFPFREFPVVGGLMSYGTNLGFAYHTSALYVARILKGDKPAELPVQQPTKFEFVINLKTAKALGLDIPATLLARADEVIE
jgi:putative ABC transport system substrate-binding protein